MTTGEKETTGKGSLLSAVPLPDARKLLMVVAMTAVMASSAWADDVTPRTDSVIAADVVRVGDVFDNTGRYADHVLAPAPALGGEMTLSARDLSRISDAFGFDWHSRTGMEQVVIRRDAKAIDRYQIEASLQERLNTALGGKKFELVLNDRNAIYLPPDAAASLRIEDMRYDLSRGDFRAQLSAGDVTRDVTGHLYLLTDVPVPARALKPGDTIAQEDIEYVDIRASDLSPAMIADAKGLIGQSVRRALPAMRPVAAVDVVQPALVKKGQIITIALEQGPIQLTAQGRALESGALGTSVKVMNTASHQVLDAVVTGQQRATVRAAAPPMAAM